MCVAPLRELGDARAVEHVDLVELEVRMVGERRAAERVAVQVVGRDHVVRVDELAGERRRDEAGAAGDEDALALERHAPQAYRRILRARGSDVGSLARGGRGIGRGVRRSRVAAACCGATRTPSRAARALAKLGDGTLSRATLLRELVANDEFARVAMFDDALAAARRTRGCAASGPADSSPPPGTDERAIEVPWCARRATRASGACSTSATRSRSRRTWSASSRSARRS